MKYETPELTALATATNAIQATKQPVIDGDNPLHTESSVGAYHDWE